MDNWTSAAGCSRATIHGSISVAGSSAVDTAYHAKAAVSQRKPRSLAACASDSSGYTATRRCRAASRHLANALLLNWVDVQS